MPTMISWKTDMDVLSMLLLRSCQANRPLNTLVELLAHGLWEYFSTLCWSEDIHSLMPIQSLFSTRFEDVSFRFLLRSLRLRDWSSVLCCKRILRTEWPPKNFSTRSCSPRTSLKIWRKFGSPANLAKDDWQQHCQQRQVIYQTWHA